MIRFLLITILFMSLSLKSGLSVPDLCRNPKIDSIAYLRDKQMYFFTSGGYYWFVKDSEFPPISTSGKPLPHGFKRGDAAIYKDTLNVCQPYGKPQEQEIYVIEKTENGNQIMVYDVISHQWKPPVLFNNDRTISVAQIDWNQPIEAIFEYNRTEMYFVQNKLYSVIDFKNICGNPDSYARPVSIQSTDTISTMYSIDAMTLIRDDLLLHFKDHKFNELKIVTAQTKDGKLVVSKRLEQKIANDFFKFQECPDQPSPGDPGEQSVEKGTVKGNETSNTAMYIIIGIVVFIIVIVGVLVLLALYFGGNQSNSEPNKTKTANKTATQTPKPKTITGQPKSPIKK